MRYLVLAASLLALSGCGVFSFSGGGKSGPVAAEPVAEPDAAKSEKADGVVNAGADMNGKAVTMKVGETLFVELKSIPTAGYVWEVKTQPAFLELGGETTRPTDPERQNQPGFTGGNHYLGTYFKATATGTGKLEMIETRPWETDEPPIGEWSLDVTVTE